jgi:uncharacterized membrane protein YkoI
MAWSKLAVTATLVLALLGPRLAMTGLDEASAAGACLNRDQRRALIASGHVVKLSTAIRHVHRHLRGDVIRAQLCRSKRGYVYLLTVLTRSGKVKRARVDAGNGRLIGVR